MVLSVLNALLLILILILLGGFLRHVRCLRAEADDSIMSFCINILYPCLIFDRISKTDIPAHLSSYWMAPLAGAASVVLFIVIMQFFVRLPNSFTGLKDSKEKHTLMSASALYNYGYMPIPILEFLYPGQEEIMTGLFIFTLGVELMVWVVVVPCLGGGLVKGWWKKVLSIPFLTILFAVTVNCLGLVPHIPLTISKAVEWIGLGQLTLPIIVIGAIIYDQLRHQAVDFRAIRTYQTTGWVMFFRCVLFPILMIFAATLLSGNPILQKILVVQAAMPTAMMIIMFTRMYGGSTPIAVQSILSTSFFSPVVAVFWISVGMHMIS